MTDKISKSLKNGKEYIVPLVERDNNLKQFLELNTDKKVVVVQGLGFVGTVMSLVIANNQNNEYAVIGVDRATEDSYWKIAQINEGNLPISSSDPKVEEYFTSSMSNNNFYATYDVEAYSYADTIIIDINLDVEKIRDTQENIISFDVPFSNFKRAIQSIGVRIASQMYWF